MLIYFQFIIIFICFIGFCYLTKKYFLRGTYNWLSKDMTNKFVIITGASAGLGEYTAKELINKGATVVYACRSEEKAKKSIEDLPEKIKDKAIFKKLDLCSINSIKSFAEDIKSNERKIDILFNNAGAQPTEFIYTADNMESFLEGNHLGPMLLTLLLIDHFAQESKIINVSSCAHYYSFLDENCSSYLSDIKEIKKHYFENPMDLFTLYSDCKMFNLYFAQYLSELCKKEYPNIKSASLHPGASSTSFFRFLNNDKNAKKMYEIIGPIFTKNTEWGAQTHLYLSYLPFNEMVSGAYYSECAVASISKKAQDKKIRNASMKWSLDALHQYLNETDYRKFKSVLE